MEKVAEILQQMMLPCLSGLKEWPGNNSDLKQFIATKALARNEAI